MGDAAGAWDLLQVETIGQFAGSVPQSFAMSQIDGRDGEVHRVNEVGFEEFSDRGNTSADADVFSLSRLERLCQRILRRCVDEVEGGLPTSDCGSQMMRENEDRRVEWGLVAPPAFPVVVLPRSTLRAELVAPHDLGANVQWHPPTKRARRRRHRRMGAPGSGRNPNRSHLGRGRNCERGPTVSSNSSYIANKQKTLVVDDVGNLELTVQIRSTFGEPWSDAANY